MKHFALFPAVVIIRSWPPDCKETTHKWQKTLWLSLSTEWQTQAELCAKSARLSKEKLQRPSFFQ